MTNVLLTTDSTDLQTRVHQAAGGSCIAVPSHPLPSDPAQLLAHVQHQALPDVLVLDATRAPHDALALAGRFDRELPGTGLVLIGDPEALSIAAMRVGVRDVLPEHVDVETLRAALLRVGQAVQTRRAQPDVPPAVANTMIAPGRVLTVLSPKGGAGKTTLATNLAVGLAQSAPGAVVLVDLDVQFGDVATALNIEPEYALDDVLQGHVLRDPIALKTRLTQHSSGLLVVCAPDTPAAADSVTPEQVSELLASLSAQFRYVVVDTAAGLEPRTLAALDHTTDPVLLTTFDVAGARGLRKEVATLRELGMLTNARQVLLNFADPKAGLSVSDVEATIRTKVDLTIPISRSVTASLNTGVPIVLQRPKDPVAKQMRKLITFYAETGARRANGRHRAAA
ncbi:AAA family ATPase [Agrococcus jenensis]|uniref:Pilus assembly protein CpaE n=1 Tax=Agrococcus jenensis TaxID=46353 RepID=A0A3N2ATU7_9MICO|nr:P-loop NTPase [Agrococcus jenensis]ROR66426.1 pilus assembly protein CpaE [Agrococcus jenensis]